MFEFISMDGEYCKPEFVLRTTTLLGSQASSGIPLLAEKTLKSLREANPEACSTAFAEIASKELPVTLQLETMTSGREFRISKTSRFMSGDALESAMELWSAMELFNLELAFA